jgi:hypothetical protein
MSTAMLTAIQQQTLQPAIFAQLTFANETVYVWSGFGTINWNGQNWSGVGQLGSLSNIPDNSTVEAKGIMLTLSGIDATLLPEGEFNYGLGLPATIWLGFFNNGVLIANPVIAFQGRMDQPQFDVAGTAITLSINCEDRLMDMNAPVDRRYTQDDQQRDWPGDLGMQFVPSIQEMTLYWGTAPTSTANI